MNEASIQALRAVELAELMYAKDHSMASIRNHILRDTESVDATTLAYVEGYLACMARRAIG